MKVFDLINSSPWAILPEALDTIHEVLAARVYDGKMTLDELEARAGKELDNSSSSYMDGSTMVIPVHGIIAKRMNLFTRISGGTSTEILQRDIQDGLKNPDVKAILLDVESPGGSVDGPFELSDFIFKSRGQKPIYAFANGLMASAAYLISSAADRIISSQAAQVGSIGVISAHYDYSKRDEKIGVKRTFLTAGKYKAVAHDAAPLSKDDRRYIQDRLDFLYTMFVDSIARNRGVSVEKVLSDMADGKIFIGDQAISVGLIDGIGTFADAKAGKGKEIKEAMKTTQDFDKKTIEEARELVATGECANLEEALLRVQEDDKLAIGIFDGKPTDEFLQAVGKDKPGDEYHERVQKLVSEQAITLVEAQEILDEEIANSLFEAGAVPVSHGV